MPGAGERHHHGHPDFQIRNRIFATLWPREHRAVLKLSLVDQAALLKSSPRTFSTNAWSHQGWTNVHLQHIAEVRFRELVEKPWRRIAPKTIVTAHEADKSKHL